MRKTFHLLAAMLLCAASAVAGEITEKQAYQIAGRFFNSSQAMRKAPATQGEATITLAQAAEGYYAFNRGRGGGYVIVAADDHARAEVLGYSRAQTFVRIVLPQVVKRIMPAMTNEVITLVKDTSLAFSIGVIEMFTVAKQLVASQVSMAPFAIAAAFYWVFNLLIDFVAGRIERKLSYYHD